MYLMSSFMYIYHFSLSQWLIFNQKWAKNIRGHAQTMWTAMGGGGVHEMSTLLIKPI